MDNTPNSILFWRNERWHAGWLQCRREDGGFQVAWIEGKNLLVKVVPFIIPIPTVEFEVVSSRPTE